jgi:hypothetical protein
MIKILIRRVGPGQIYLSVAGFDVQTGYGAWRRGVRGRVSGIVTGRDKEAGEYYQ